MVYKLKLSNLTYFKDLYGEKTIPELKKQLENLGRKGVDENRYKVITIIIQGSKVPAIDIDNYSYKINNAITDTKLLWKDDEQVDEISIYRKKDQNAEDSSVEIIVFDI